MAKLIMTVEQMQDRDAWLDVRSHGIGGSDASIIVGLNPWRSLVSLWMEKTGQMEPADLSDNEKVYWGTQLEDMVAREFSKRTGKEVHRKGVLQSEEYPFLLASVDRVVVGENAGLECKTASGYMAKEWEGDEIPDAYFVQCQHYMLVTGAERWYIAVLIGGNKFVWKVVERSEDDIKALLEAEKAFWNLVETNTMPEVDGFKDCTNAISERFSTGGGPAIELPSEAAEILKNIDEFTQAQNNISEQIELERNKLRAMLGDSEVGTVGERKVTWKVYAGKVSVDNKRLQAEMPEVYKEYTKQGKPYRVFKIAG